MFWVFIGLMAVYSLFLPVMIQTDIQHHTSTQTRVTLLLLGLKKTWQTAGTTTFQQLSQKKNRQVLSLLRRCDKARIFLLHHLHLNKLDALILLRTTDAAHTALLAGAAQLAVALPQRVRIRVMPDFYHAHSTIQVRCIIKLRLGIILLTMIMLLGAYIRQQQAESEV